MFCQKCGHRPESPGQTFCPNCGTAFGNGPPPQGQFGQMPPMGGGFGRNNYIGVRRSGGIVLLLSIVTCGIYSFYFLYQCMEDINRASGEQRISSVGLLVGSILCFPILYVAYYQIDRELARLAAENGTYYKENFTMWLLLTFLCGIGLLVADFNICKGFNDIWDKRQGVGAPRMNQWQ